MTLKQTNNQNAGGLNIDKAGSSKAITTLLTFHYTGEPGDDIAAFGVKLIVTYSGSGGQTVQMRMREIACPTSPSDAAEFTDVAENGSIGVLTVENVTPGMHCFTINVTPTIGNGIWELSVTDESVNNVGLFEMCP